MKKSVSKQVKGLSNAEYAKLLTAVAEYRKNIKASVSGKSGKDPFKTFGRIFTEPRVNGLRSKYWVCGDKATAIIQKYVKKNPTITIGKKVYAVKVVHNSGSKDPGYRYALFNPQSTALYVTKVS